MSAGNVFRSRIDVYYFLFAILPSLFMLRIFLHTVAGGGWAVPLIILVSLPFILFSIAASVRRKYTFTESGLRVDGAWNKEEIPYSSIKSAENTTDMSGTVSVIITYGTSLYKTERELIDPARKEEFVAQLAKRLPGLREEINKLVIGDCPVAERDIYKTKIGRAYRYSLTVCLYGALLTLFGALLFRNDNISFVLVALFVFFFVIALLPLAFVLSRRKIRYMFTESGLLIETMFRSARMMLYYEAITSVTEMRSFSIFMDNVYGASADLIEIAYGHGEASVHISPKKKEEFLTKLSSMLPDPKIIVRGGGKTA